MLVKLLTTHSGSQKINWSSLWRSKIKSDPPSSLEVLIVVQNIYFRPSNIQPGHIKSFMQILGIKLPRLETHIEFTVQKIYVLL